MNFENLSILELVHVDAPCRITSSELEEQLAGPIKKFGMKPDILQSLTGIAARRFWEEGTQPSDAATLAADLAIKNSGIDKSSLGILVNTSVCRDYIEPSVASLVHGNLGLDPECINFDITNACLGFLNGIEVVGNMIEHGQVDYGIIVNGENSRTVIESTIRFLNTSNCDEQTFREHFATLTLGSGAAAMILTRSDLAPNGHKVIGAVTLAATEHSRLCLGQTDKMTVDTKTLLKSGLNLMASTLSKAKEVNGWDADTFDKYIFHQISSTHFRKMLEQLGISEEKVYATYPEFGNIGPAAIPITLSKAVEAGRINRGDNIGLLGIGSGINFTLMNAIW